MAVSCDGKHVFTAGGVDGSVHMWQLNPAVLAAQLQLQGTGMPAFFDILEGVFGTIYRPLALLLN